MIVIGVDAHKRTHTLVAVDAAGRKRGQKTVDATTAGHGKALVWARREFGTDLLWGVEDVRSVSARLERDLIDSGETVVRVPTRMMVRVRRAARTRGKSDPIDALAAARAVLQESDLPVARHDPASRACKLLVDRREDLVRQRTALVTRLLWRIHELDPVYAATIGNLKLHVHRDGLRDWLQGRPGLVAELARDEVDDITALTVSINTLTQRIDEHVRSAAPNLLALQGCGALTAAKIVAETADVTRFKSEAAFARHAGLGPTPRWSAEDPGEFRYKKSGNRQLNSALHRIALVQIRMGGPGARYYRERIDAGDSPTAARRCLKRRLARVVFTRMRSDHYSRVPQIY